ncbi:hypothetical protein NG726_07885 [Pseudomonas sp. MOB-449]|nr:hypothetical protein [Pseudomonas sp. MOB-449]
MIVEDRERAIRKITQVGYYRLSGYWHVARHHETREDRTRVYPNPSPFFRDVISLGPIRDVRHFFDTSIKSASGDGLKAP